MQLYQLLNGLLELLIPCSEEEAHSYHLGKKRNSLIRVLFPKEEPQSYFIIKQLNEYISILEKIFLLNEKIRLNFSKITVFELVERKINIQKSNSQSFTAKNTKEFFNEFLSKEPSTYQAITSISGVFLENITQPVNMGNFTIFNQQEMLLDQVCHRIHIQIDIKNIYDIEIAKIKSQIYFNDFIKLILFISCNFDGQDKYKVEIGKGFDRDISSTFSCDFPNKIQFKNIRSNRDTVDIFNTDIFHKISLQDPFFIENNTLKTIWKLYDKQINHQNPTDIEMRILNTALAIGESARTLNIQNSLIYTCIALEVLFMNNREDKIRTIVSKNLASLISKNQKDYAFIKKLTAQVYDARSDIVHGRRLSVIPDFSFVNKLLRQAIIELLNNSKYKDVQTINDLRKMITDVKHSD